nr:hypothetical protein [uncultured Roseateles sp.]
MKRKLLKAALLLVAMEIATTALAGSFLASRWPELRAHVPAEVAAVVDRALIK